MSVSIEKVSVKGECKFRRVIEKVTERVIENRIESELKRTERVTENNMKVTENGLIELSS